MIAGRAAGGEGTASKTALRRKKSTQMIAAGASVTWPSVHGTTACGSVGMETHQNVRSAHVKSVLVTLKSGQVLLHLQKAKGLTS